MIYISIISQLRKVGTVKDIIFSAVSGRSSSAMRLIGCGVQSSTDVAGGLYSDSLGCAPNPGGMGGGVSRKS